MRLTLTEYPDGSHVRFIEDKIYEFNLATTGITDVRFLSIIAREPDDQLVGGLYGWTWGRCCEVKTLWVSESVRGRGLGTRLMQSAKEEARAPGATQIVLSTHSFQAPGFYRRLGFIVVGEVKDYPEGDSSIYLRKPLSGTNGP